MENSLTWEVLEYVGNSNSAQSVKRLSDDLIFKLGDLVTNGTQMRGKIKEFNFSFRGKEIYVVTDWSGVGMGLESLNHVQMLPSKFQIGDNVLFGFIGDTAVVQAKVNSVLFHSNHVKYDLELYSSPNVGLGKATSTRIYNVSEECIKAQ